MLAASLQDLDGFGVFISQALWWDCHHVLGHNLCFGIFLSTLLTYFSFHRIKAFTLYILLFHLHVFLDYYGSGPGWGIAYLWPLGSWHLINPAAWTFDAWQNVAAGYGAVASEWSKGQVEGQINTLKLLKRPMYGWAKLDLLKARMLQAVRSRSHSCGTWMQTRSPNTLAL